MAKLNKNTDGQQALSQESAPRNKPLRYVSLGDFATEDPRNPIGDQEKQIVESLCRQANANMVETLGIMNARNRIIISFASWNRKITLADRTRINLFCEDEANSRKQEGVQREDKEISGNA